MNLKRIDITDYKTSFVFNEDTSYTHYNFSLFGKVQIQWNDQLRKMAESVTQEIWDRYKN